MKDESCQTLVEIFFGNIMILWLNNCFSMELGDIFLMPLLKEGVRGDEWSMIYVMNQSG